MSGIGPATLGYYESGGGSGDVTAPVVVSISPTPDTAPGEPGGFPAIRNAALLVPVVINVSDETNLVYVGVSARYFGSRATLNAGAIGVEEEIYRAGQFQGRYQTASSQVDDGTLTLTVMRDGGWGGRFIRFSVDAVDAGGNVTSEQFVWELPVPQTSVVESLEEATSGAVDYVSEGINRLPLVLRKPKNSQSESDVGFDEGFDIPLIGS